MDGHINGHKVQVQRKKKTTNEAVVGSERRQHRWWKMIKVNMNPMLVIWHQR